MTKISRRTFARDAVVIATAAAVMPAVIAQTPPAPPPTEAKPPGEPSAAAPKLSPASQAEVDARVNWIFTKYGARLDDAQRADIRRLVAGGQAGIDAMRAYPLGNEVEPPSPFHVWRAPKVTK